MLIDTLWLLCHFSMVYACHALSVCNIGGLWSHSAVKSGQNRSVSACMPQLTHIVVFCDPESYWGRPLGMETWSMHFGSNNLCMSHCLTIFWASCYDRTLLIFAFWEFMVSNRLLIKWLAERWATLKIFLILLHAWCFCKSLWRDSPHW